MTLTNSSLKDWATELKAKKEARPFSDTLQLKANRKLLFLTSLIQKFAKPGTPGELAKLVAEEIGYHLKADQVSLLLRDAQGFLQVWSQFNRLALPYPTDVSQSICETIMAGESVLISEALNHPYFQTKESVLTLNLRSVIACPIASMNSSTPVGVLYACSYTTGELFKPEDMDTLKAIAVVVGINLDRTQLLAQKDRFLKEQQAVAASRRRVVSPEEAQVLAEILAQLDWTKEEEEIIRTFSLEKISATISTVTQLIKSQRAKERPAAGGAPGPEAARAEPGSASPEALIGRLMADRYGGLGRVIGEDKDSLLIVDTLGERYEIDRAAVREPTEADYDLIRIAQRVDPARRPGESCSNCERSTAQAAHGEVWYRMKMKTFCPACAPVYAQEQAFELEENVGGESS